MTGFDCKEAKVAVSEDINRKSGNLMKAWVAGLIVMIPTILVSVNGAFTQMSEDANWTSNFFKTLVTYLIAGALTGGYYAYCSRSIKEGTGAQKEESIFDKFTRGEYVRFTLFGILYDIAISLGIICFVIPGIYAAMAFFMGPFIMNDNPEMGAIEAMSASRKLMKGHKWELFKVVFSFIGWYILAICTFGLIGPWVETYLTQVLAKFYEHLKSGEGVEPAEEVEVVA